MFLYFSKNMLQSLEKGRNKKELMEIFRSVHTNALTMFTWFFKDNSHFWDGRPELRHFRRIWRILWDRAVRGDSVLHDRSDILYKVTQFIYGGSLIFVNMQLIARFIYNAHKHVAIQSIKFGYPRKSTLRKIALHNKYKFSVLLKIFLLDFLF